MLFSHEIPTESRKDMDMLNRSLSILWGQKLKKKKGGLIFQTNDLGYPSLWHSCEC